MDYYPENTLQSYSVTLESQLILDNDYKVGLCEIMFPKKWKISIGKLVIIKDSENNGTESEIILDLVGNDKVSMRKVNADINEILSEYKLEKQIKLLYDPKLFKYVFHIADGYQIEMSGSVKNILGFKKTVLYKYAIADNKVLETETINIVSAMYVYTDIIEHQFVGDAKVQLLRTVSTHINKDDHLDIIFDSPHYIPLIKRKISSIYIQLSSDTGEKILFQSGKVLIKVYLRPR